MKATCASNYVLFHLVWIIYLAGLLIDIIFPIDKIIIRAQYPFPILFIIILEMFSSHIIFFRTASVVDSYPFLRRKYHYRRRRGSSREKTGKEEPKRMRKRKEDLENQVICAPKQEFLVKLSIQFPCFLVRYSVFLSCRFSENLSSAETRSD